jgi:hypothetical protein
LDDFCKGALGFRINERSVPERLKKLEGCLDIRRLSREVNGFCKILGADYRDGMQKSAFDQAS